MNLSDFRSQIWSQAYDNYFLIPQLEETAINVFPRQFDGTWEESHRQLAANNHWMASAKEFGYLLENLSLAHFEKHKPLYDFLGNKIPSSKVERFYKNFFGGIYGVQTGFGKLNTLYQKAKMLKDDKVIRILGVYDNGNFLEGEISLEGCVRGDYAFITPRTNFGFPSTRAEINRFISGKTIKGFPKGPFGDCNVLCFDGSYRKPGFEVIKSNASTPTFACIGGLSDRLLRPYCVPNTLLIRAGVGEAEKLKNRLI